jgi:hypothetical protein
MTRPLVVVSGTSSIRMEGSQLQGYILTAPSLKGQSHAIYSLFFSTPDYHFLVRFNLLISNIWEIFTTFQ